MKRIAYSLLLFLILCTYNVKSQTYYPLVADSVHWFIALDNGVFGAGTYSSIFEYYSIGDTIVNSNTYKKVYKRDIQSLNSNYQAPYQPLTPYTLFALLREDTASRIVYTIILQNNPNGSNCLINQEELLYDFGLNLGDSLNTCTIGSGPHPCPEITSIYPWVIYGYNTNVFEILCTYNTQYYEGIGSWDGLFEEESTATATALKNYCRGADINCGLTSSVFEIPNTKSFDIYPNPTFGFIQIKSIESLTLLKEVSISDVFGKVLIFFPLLKSVQHVDISSLKPGIYILSIKNKDKETIQLSKIIKL